MLRSYTTCVYITYTTMQDFYTVATGLHRMGKRHCMLASWLPKQSSNWSD